MFIVPRIVPLEYVSTTLGLHKSVCMILAIRVPALKFCLQLENTGTTITQTISGLWLDSEEKEEKPGSLKTLSGNEPHLQWLLNGFLLVNILHLVATFGLGYLNKIRQNPRNEEAMQIGAADGEERRSTSGSSSGNGEPSSPPSRISSSRILDADHPASPIYPPRDASFVYQGDGIQSRSNSPQQDTSTRGAASPAEVKRGKLFATLCTATVVSAWLLFFVTSFLKIRSRREREGRL